MMFEFPKTKKRKKIEAENEELKLQVSELEYNLADKKSNLKFYKESEGRKQREVWAERRESKKLKSEIAELESNIREQSDADLMLLALQGVGLVLSKGDVDKFVKEEVQAKENESVRKRMVRTGVESPLGEQRRRDCAIR